MNLMTTICLAVLIPTVFLILLMLNVIRLQIAYHRRCISKLMVYTDCDPPLPDWLLKSARKQANKNQKRR